MDGGDLIILEQKQVDPKNLHLIDHEALYFHPTNLDFHLNSNFFIQID